MSFCARKRTRVVPSGCLRDFTVRLRLHCVDEVRELDSILDEEDWNVVANNVCKKVSVKWKIM